MGLGLQEEEDVAGRGDLTEGQRDISGKEAGCLILSRAPGAGETHLQASPAPGAKEHRPCPREKGRDSGSSY